ERAGTDEAESDNGQKNRSCMTHGLLLLEWGYELMVRFPAREQAVFPFLFPSPPFPVTMGQRVSDHNPAFQTARRTVRTEWTPFICKFSP
ncbi:MAG: hypothetical protein QUS35_05215, partial [bacterium]|nr:hypothetical protein [bacterium]